MRFFVTFLIAVASVSAQQQQQQQIDPAYLRQYYHQLSQQNGGVGVSGQSPRSAPIFEPQEQQAPQQFAHQAPVRNVKKKIFKILKINLTVDF